MLGPPVHVASSGGDVSSLKAAGDKPSYPCSFDKELGPESKSDSASFPESLAVKKSRLDGSVRLAMDREYVLMRTPHSFRNRCPRTAGRQSLQGTF